MECPTNTLSLVDTRSPRHSLKLVMDLDRVQVLVSLDRVSYGSHKQLTEVITLPEVPDSAHLLYDDQYK